MMQPFVLLLGAVLLGVLGQFLMKSGMNRVGAIDHFGLPALVRMLSNPFVLLGFASYAVSSIAYLLVLSKVNLSMAYPMVGVGYVLVMLVSVVLLRETVSPLRWVGALLIVSGVFLMGR
ncbi:MAG: EamA family transporter [Anaerolineae bacterium]